MNEPRISFQRSKRPIEQQGELELTNEQADE